MKFIRIPLSIIKWVIVAAILLEAFCFIVVTISNYAVYGSPFEGSRARYDAHTLFLQETVPRPTKHTLPTDSPNSRCVIWMFGGSTMRGSTPDDGKTIPSFVAKGMNSCRESAHYTVINFGINSFNSLLETKYLQKLLIEESEKPDLIIFYDGANDCTYFAQYRTPYGHHGYRRVRALIESYRKSFFGLFKAVNAALQASSCKELYDKIRQVAVPIKADDPVLKAFVDLTEKRYDHISKLAGCYGAEFILVWQPVYWVESGSVSSSVHEQEKNYMLNVKNFPFFEHNFNTIYNALETRLSLKPYCIRFRNILRERKQPVYKADGVHLNDRGRQEVGTALVRLLKARKLSK